MFKQALHFFPWTQRSSTIHLKKTCLSENDTVRFSPALREEISTLGFSHVVRLQMRGTCRWRQIYSELADLILKAVMVWSLWSLKSDLFIWVIYPFIVYIRTGCIGVTLWITKWEFWYRRENKVGIGSLDPMRSWSTRKDWNWKTGKYFFVAMYYF